MNESDRWGLYTFPDEIAGRPALAKLAEDTRKLLELIDALPIEAEAPESQEQIRRGPVVFDSVLPGRAHPATRHGTAAWVRTRLSPLIVATGLGRQTGYVMDVLDDDGLCALLAVPSSGGSLTALRAHDIRETFKMHIIRGQSLAVQEVYGSKIREEKPTNVYHQGSSDGTEWEADNAPVDEGV